MLKADLKAYSVKEAMAGSKYKIKLQDLYVNSPIS